MNRALRLLSLVVIVGLAASFLGGCGSTNVETAEDLEGTWAGSWYSFATVDTEAPEVWADGSITFHADGTYEAEFIPKDEGEEPFVSEAEFTIEEDGDDVVLTIFGQGYVVGSEESALTLTAKKDDGSMDVSPTFVLEQE
jgi:hypothetical protein